VRKVGRVNSYLSHQDNDTDEKAEIRAVNTTNGLEGNLVKSVSI
jgi:hypothetical protein